MKESIFKCLCVGLLISGMTLAVQAGGIAGDQDELERELARTQNELDRQKTRSDDLESRLNDLNNQMADLASREPAAYETTTSVRSMSLLDEDFPIHGYIAASLADADRDILTNPENVSGLDEDSTFNQEILVFWFDYEIDENYRVYADLAFQEGTEIFVDGDAVEGNGDVVVQEAFVEWSPEFGRDYNVNVLMGKFFTPFGVWTPDEIEPTTHSVFDPLLDRWAFHSEFTTGVQVNASCEVGNVTVDKAFFVGNGQGPRPHSDDENNNRVIGARVAGTVPVVDEGQLTLGLSGEIGRESFTASDLQQKIYGLDARLDIANFTFRAESSRSRVNAPARHFWQKVWYGMVSYHFLDHYDVFYRYDDGDDDEGREDAGDIEINSVGIAYRPIEPVVFKVQYEKYDDDDRATEEYEVWAGQVSALF